MRHEERLVGESDDVGGAGARRLPQSALEPRHLTIEFVRHALGVLEDAGVQHDEVRGALVERVEVRAEVGTVAGQALGVGHLVVGAGVVIARHVVERYAGGSPAAMRFTSATCPGSPALFTMSPQTTTKRGSAVRAMATAVSKRRVSSRKSVTFGAARTLRPWRR